MIAPPAPSSPSPSAPPLVGRERELVALREALAAALAGRGSLVLIGGEAGIGKTVLAETICAEARQQGALVLVGRCYDLAETPPHGPWVEALVDVPRGDGLSPPPDLAGGGGIVGQAAIFAAVRDYLAALAARQPVVLLLDDLHWADLGSLDLLRFFTRGLGDSPILALAAYRVDELTRRHPLYQLLPALVREAGAERVALRRLGEEATQALVRARYALSGGEEARLVAYLGAHAGGNPLYAGELLRALAEQGVLVQRGDAWALGDLAGVRVPPLLRQVIDARVDRLGEEVRALLAIAAVIGQVAPLDLWAAVGEVQEEALLTPVERAIEAGLLAETDGGVEVRFTHALIREALYEGLAPVRRRIVHRRAGAVLATLSQSDPDAVAYHFRQASDPRAAEWLITAGERASRSFAYLTAADRYEAALALIGEHEAQMNTRGWLFQRLARMYTRLDRNRSLSYLADAALVAERTGDRVLAAVAQAEQGIHHSWIVPFSRGLAELQAGIAALESLNAEDRTRLASLNISGAVPVIDAFRGSLVFSLARTGRFAEAVVLAEQVVSHRADPPITGAMHAASGFATAKLGIALAHAARGRPVESRLAFAQTYDAHRAIGHNANIAHGLFHELLFAVVPYQADDVAGRRLVAERGERAWTSADDVVGALSPRLVWLPILLIEGCWDEARALSEQGTLVISAYARSMILAPIAQAQGDARLAWSIVHEALPGGPATEPGDTSYAVALATQRLAAALALDDRDFAAARQWLEVHDHWLAWSGAVLGRATGDLGWAAYHRAIGDHAQSRAHAERALAHATEPRQPLALLAAHRLLGELDTAAGRHSEARVHLKTALALTEACAAPYERALTLLALAELHVAERQHDAVIAALTEARDLLIPLEARPALARADTLAARLTVPSVASAPALPFGLSAREAEVLRLVAQGLPDAEVAERLFLSRRTVHAHLRTIYGKLGVASRSAATRLAIEHNLA